MEAPCLPAHCRLLFFLSQLLSLTLDGLTGVSQDHMRAHYQTGSNHMMLNINLWSTFLLGAGILFTGELWEFLSFAERYPTIIYNILLFGLTSALGQVSSWKEAAWLSSCVVQKEWLGAEGSSWPCYGWRPQGCARSHDASLPRALSS